MKNLLALACILWGLAAFCQKESLSISWPQEYHFKEISNQSEGQVHITEMVPEKEDGENWTLLTETMVIKGAVVPATAVIVQLFEQSTRSESPDAKLTVLEADDKAKNIWVIFKVETPKFPDDPLPESQLYYAIQGAEGLYVNFIAIKEKELTKEFISRWSAVFKASKLVSQL